MQRYRTITKIKGWGPDLELADDTLELPDGRTVDIADLLEQSRKNLTVIDLRSGSRRELVSPERWRPGIRRQYTRREREFVLECAQRGDWFAICDRYSLTTESLAEELAKRFQMQIDSEDEIFISNK